MASRVLRAISKATPLLAVYKDLSICSVPSKKNNTREGHARARHSPPRPSGTQKLVALYGERLVCVRYRYDAASGTRYKTVELIVDQTAWVPPPPHPHADQPVLRADHIDDPETPLPQQVGVKVFFRENELRERVKAAGGQWSKAEKLWRLSYQTAVSLGLKHRIAKR